MTTNDPEHADGGDPPLGSWARVYTAVAVLAVVIMLLLYWFTEAFDIPLEAR